MKLPELVPCHDPVTVCAACERAACVLGRFVCDARKGGALEVESRPLATVRAAAKESPSYWKPQRPERNSDYPIDVEELERLVRWSRVQPYPERQLIAGYLEHELGIDAEQVAAAMAKEWPEAEVSP